MTDASPQSPCVSICALDENDICQGCYRTGNEITDWFLATDAEKRVILQACAERRQRLNPVTLR